MRPMFLCNDESKKLAAMRLLQHLVNICHVFNALVNTVARNLCFGSSCAHDGKAMLSLASRLLPWKSRYSSRFVKRGASCFLDWCTLCIHTACSKHLPCTL
uniref:Uncharacterized protein n=1 Tax=Rhipicephalus microplus TaxID=6941 RepID=A0A6G5AG42_RHIMP